MTTQQEIIQIQVNGKKYPVPKSNLKLSKTLETHYSGRFSDKIFEVDFEKDTKIGLFIVYSYILTNGKSKPIFKKDNFLPIIVVADYLNVQDVMDYVKNYISNSRNAIPENYIVLYKNFPWIQKSLRDRLIEYYKYTLSIQNSEYEQLAEYIGMNRVGEYVYSKNYPVTEKVIQYNLVDPKGNFVIPEEVFDVLTNGDKWSLKLTEIFTKEGYKYYCIRFTMYDQYEINVYRNTRREKIEEHNRQISERFEESIMDLFSGGGFIFDEEVASDILGDVEKPMYHTFSFVYTEGKFLVLEDNSFRSSSTGDLLSVHNTLLDEVHYPEHKALAGSIFFIDKEPNTNSDLEIKDSKTGHRLYFHKHIFYGYISPTNLAKLIAGSNISKNMLL